MTEDNQTETFEFAQRPVIKGFPELRWTGKHPYTSTQYFPAQLKESYGEPVDGWMNKLFWGDNLQVMSHLLKEYRGKVDLIYIDPPFDSKADYKKRIKLRGKSVLGDSSSFEEKQYGDIWSSDEYLQFMYERLALLWELLSDRGTMYLHCDWHKSHYLRMVSDEVFGPNNFLNEIVWCYEDIGSRAVDYFKRKHDSILVFQKRNSSDRVFNVIRKRLSESTIKRYKPYFNEDGIITYRSLKESNPGVFAKLKGVPEDLDMPWLDIENGAPLSDWWTDISALKNGFAEAVGYPTQKPEALVERIIRASTNPGDLVFDCFMGSGTTQAVAMKLGRRFLGADINLGAIQTTTKRLLAITQNLEGQLNDGITYYTGFEVYNVNNYDFFRNPIEARELIIQALDIQKLNEGNVYDGELDGRMVKILPTNRIATKADLNDFVSHLPIKTFEERKADNPSQSVERMTLVCMGHEPDLKASLESELAEFKLDVEICDILRDKSDLQFKHDAEAEVIIEGDELVIKSFYPLNLMQKLSLDRTTVNDWKELTDSVLIDWNYDGAVLEPAVQDIPGRNEFVKGRYKIPSDAGTIKVKITDVLSESIEMLVEA